MYQNYIFDLYGTLVDIHTDEYSKNFFKKYAKWLRKQGFYFEWKGHGGNRLFRRAQGNGPQSYH